MRNDKGMTLIELVAAMGVFAVISVMAVQALSGTLRTRDRLLELQKETADLTRSVALLRNDLAAAVPLAFYPPDRRPPRSPVHMSAGGTVFQISVAGQTVLSNTDVLRTDATGRVEWRFDAATDTLFRRTWQVLDPLNTAAATPEVAVMQGVRGLEVETYWPDGRGWRPGTSNQSGGASNFDGDNTGASVWFSMQLPDAVALTLDTEAYGAIRIVETFQ